MLCRSLLLFSLSLCIPFAGAQGAYEAGEERPGGATSTGVEGRNAYSMPSANLPLSRRLDFNVGNSFFRNPWVSAPASTDARDGLGPLFNTNGCQNCHIKDGRGHVPEGPEDNAVSMLVRLSIPPTTSAEHAFVARHGVLPEPTYGGQLQDFALPGIAAEGQIRIHYQKKVIALNGGETAILRQPTLRILDLGYGPMHPETMLSARVAPPMIGLGLLEAIPETDLLAQADPDDRDNDGISGKANRVWDERAGTFALGRFGWKAGQPNLMQQNAGAFNGDVGIVSSLFAKDDCTEAQSACLQAPSGGAAEVSDEILRFVEFYTRNLAVPVRPQARDPEVLAGKALFAETGCAACHRPSWQTAESGVEPELAGQTIWPYSDLLLHDIGPDLADGRPEYAATGQEWRTPPLWGLSQLPAVNGHTQLLHDGRARSVLEAVLWHGGEAKASRDRVVAMSPDERTQLIRFVESL